MTSLKGGAFDPKGYDRLYPAGEGNLSMARSELERADQKYLKKIYRQYCKSAKKKHGFAVRLYFNK